MSEAGNARRGDNACAFGLDAGISESGRERFRDRCARLARVLADDDAPRRAGRKMMSQSLPDGIYSFSIQRIFPGNSTDSISPKKFSQFILPTKIFECRPLYFGDFFVIVQQLLYLRDGPGSVPFLSC